MEKGVCICILCAIKVLDVLGMKIAEKQVNQLAVIGQKFSKTMKEKKR